MTELGRHEQNQHARELTDSLLCSVFSLLSSLRSRQAELSMRLSVALLLAALLRVALILWSFHQDATSSVKYTDVDYVVFTDAARCLVAPSSSTDCTLAAGPLAPLILPGLGDPYARDTYRYTPLLAILAAPNILLHSAFGKVLFSFADLLVGILLYALVRRRGVPINKSTLYVAAIWLLNPIIANISTRGSAESVLGVLVVSVLALAERKRWDAAAIAFGLAVHFKIFPIIYGSSLLAAIGGGRGGRWISAAHVRFALLSFGSFMALNGVMFALWGQPFLEHTFLYHISRLDHRHNFSPYFYSFYLSTAPSLPSVIWFSLVRHPLAAFIPQLGLSVGLGFIFGAHDLPFAWLVQTMTFVTFNKVCTSQYFLWYLWFLPPALPSLHISRNRSIALVAVWVLSQALWLSQAFQLEMLAQPVYKRVWAASVVFFLANCWVIVELMRGWRPVVTAPRKVEPRVRWHKKKL